MDPDAQLRLFVRDGNNNFAVLDNTSAGSPKFLTVSAGEGGIYTASVLVVEGSTSYTLQVGAGETPPAPLAEFEFASNGSEDSGSWQVFRFDVVAGALVDARVSWDDPEAQMNLFLRDETNSALARDTDGIGPSTMASVTAATSGRWSVGVKVNSGTVNYSVLVDTIGEDTLEVTNIALGGIASQSSTGFGGIPSRAIDGNTDGTYSNESVTHTVNSSQPWWEVQLSELSTIETIILYNRIYRQLLFQSFVQLYRVCARR